MKILAQRPILKLISVNFLKFAFFTYLGDKTVEEYSRERKGCLKGISIRWRKSSLCSV